MCEIIRTATAPVSRIVADGRQRLPLKLYPNYRGKGEILHQLLLAFKMSFPRQVAAAVAAAACQTGSPTDKSGRNGAEGGRDYG